MNGAQRAAGSAIPLFPGSEWIPAGIGDFNGDGRDDIAWRSLARAQTRIWMMNGFGIQAAGPLPLMPNQWSIAGVGDFDGDGRADLLWRDDQTGQNRIWLMDGASTRGRGAINLFPGLSWNVRGVGDLDGDGRADIVWRNSFNGQNRVWLMNGLARELGSAIPGQPDLDWRIVGVGKTGADASGAEVLIDPPGIEDGQVGTEYDFVFTANSLPPGLNEVLFEWSFGTGPGGTGQAVAPVNNQSAQIMVSHTYDSLGAFGLVVEASNGGNQIASNSVVVTVGEVEDREFDLTACETWSASQSGAQGVTSDVWDISTIPAGATFDIEFDALNIPDRFTVEYPIGNQVLDTGWRGSEGAFNNNPSLYPGGLSGPGEGMETDIFTRQAPDEFRVVVFGPDAGTLWNYRVRCRIDQ